MCECNCECAHHLLECSLGVINRQQPSGEVEGGMREKRERGLGRWRQGEGRDRGRMEEGGWGRK